MRPVALPSVCGPVGDRLALTPLGLQGGPLLPRIQVVKENSLLAVGGGSSESHPSPLQLSGSTLPDPRASPM